MYRRCDFTAPNVSYHRLCGCKGRRYMSGVGWATWQRREKCVKRQTVFVILFSQLRSKLQQESVLRRGQKKDDAEWRFVVTISSLALSASSSLFCRSICKIFGYDPVHLTSAGRTNSPAGYERPHTHTHTYLGGKKHTHLLNGVNTSLFTK